MKEKVLIINDDEAVRAVICSVLQSSGYLTSEASEGTEGISLAVSEKPDLILLDVMMPVMDGYETCQKLKVDPSTKDIAVIFLSSYTDPKEKIKGLEAGAVDFITNAVDHGELLARVQTHLKIRSLNHALLQSNTELIKKQKSIDESLNAAGAIQRSFLPLPTQRIRNVQSASFWTPANAIGGDIFNMIEHDEENIIFYMIDVSGHDVPSALVTISISQFLFQNSLPSRPLLSPKDLFQELNRAYPLERFNRFFTIFYLTLNTRTGKICYSSAGHPPAIILGNNGSLELLDQGGTIIGLYDASVYLEKSETLQTDDKVFLFTDGLEDKKNLSGEFYGKERLFELLKEIKDQPVSVIVDKVQKSIMSFSEGAPTQDDMSMIAFEFQGRA